MDDSPVRWYSPAILAVLGAQFFAALADNALLIVAIALLDARHAPGWATPALRIGFYAAYVMLAPFAGRWADAWPKGWLMSAVNAVKLAGAVTLALGAHPLVVFAAIGCGAAAYAPARYGILPELLPGRELVRANAAMEIVTIGAILGGFALGSWLVSASAAGGACAILGTLYAIGTACTLAVGRGASARSAKPVRFRSGAGVLLRDRAACASLALTSIFWSAAAVLQFLMIDWARRTLGLSLSAAACLPAVFAAGMVSGALVAASLPAFAGATSPRVCAIALGGTILLMPMADSLALACVLLVLAGLLAGALLVPLNATLQERGATLMLPGLSVAVQNFFENGLSIIFLAAYGAALAWGASLNASIYGLGLAVIVLVSLNLSRRLAPAKFPPKEHRC
jgi:MFS family permease